jgi:hypothetical protein
VPPPRRRRAVPPRRCAAVPPRRRRRAAPRAASRRRPADSTNVRLPSATATGIVVAMKLARPPAAFAAWIAMLAFAVPAGALPDDPARERAAGMPTVLEQAREESAVADPPASRYDLPAGVLRVTPSELLAAAHEDLDVSVTLERDVADGVLELTLPSRWVGRSGVSDLPYASVPEAAAGSAAGAQVRRSGRVVRFAFTGAGTGDVASLNVTDEGLPAGSYELPYRWSEAGEADEPQRTARVVLYAPSREEAEGARDWRSLLRDANATSDALAESETFVSVVPGNRQRFVVGANGAGYNAWITNDGGTSFAKASVSASLDAPGELANEAGSLCCDPTSTADAAGNLWYGGLAAFVSAATPSRIVVARAAAPAAVLFGPTVGLPQRTGTASVSQDKPMMTIDNAPASPSFGRLYVVWDEPATGVNVVVSQCDTRPGGGPDAANCDDADHWTVPVSVTPSAGSYIYADVAVGPGGTVYVVWWDYSASNAIRGDACAAASQNCASAAGWGTPQTVATLNATGGLPIAFACPILAQPGGRAGPSPQVDVDRSGGADSGRVYVTWGDLRAGSGTTRCDTPPSPIATPPLASHLTWDGFVASAAGGLPGGASPSASEGTRLLTDGEGGGQASSDEWFPWLAVDQSSGQAWADFYSTRDDPTRKTTQFYARSVTPTASGHLLGALHRVSTAASDYSASACCTFGNDYGDYTGIDATQGVALPVWSDKRGGLDGEAFVDAVLNPVVAAVEAPPPPLPAPRPPPPPPPPVPPAPVVDTTIVFRLTGRSPQRSPGPRGGIVVTMSCPQEACRVVVKAAVSVPSPTRSAKATKVSLRSASVALAKGRKADHAFKLSTALRRRIARALRGARTRNGVAVLITATAVDAAGNASTKRRTIEVRR